jgi:hypothetical protein
MNEIHGSEGVQLGRVKGATTTDYFYFFCPNCEKQHLLRILDFQVLKEEKEFKYDEKPKPKRTFTIAFEIYCSQCKLRDWVKISNDGWQGGDYSDAINLIAD